MKIPKSYEYLSMKLQESTTNDDDSNTPVELDISYASASREIDLGAIHHTCVIKEVDFPDKSIEEGKDVSKEGFETDTIDKPLEINNIPGALYGPITKEIFKDHDCTEERKDQFETEIIDTVIERREFPDAFYDPNTNEVMKDPVVIPNGESYERSDIIEQRGDDIEPTYKLYPNRALLAIITETVKLSGDSIEAGMKRLSKTIQTSMNQFISNYDFQPLPDAYYCPITFDLIHFPVIDAEGYTFEKVAIEACIQQNGKSPITRTSLSKEDLYDNHAITALLDEEKGKSVENIHPSIRNFIDAVPPEAPQNRNTSQVIVEVHHFPITSEELEEQRLIMRCNIFIITIGIFLTVIIITAMTL